MNTLKWTRLLSISSRLFRLAVLTACLFAPVLWFGVSAQSLPARPVARLITNTAAEVRTSRPRRVSVRAGDARRSLVSAPAAFPSLSQATETERRAFEATNQVRAKNGFSPLNWDGALTHMARTHSEKMALLGFFAHETPEGLRLRDRAKAARIPFQVIGENLAYNQGVDDPGAFAVQRWMISSGHRANILSREFRSSGVGSFAARDGRVYLTQIFIAR